MLRQERSKNGKRKFRGVLVHTESSKSRIYKAFKSLDLVFEATRLQTFIDWPLEKPNPSELATDGFIYTRTKDYCTCVFCWQLIQIEINDNPRQKHERIAPFCPFIRDQPVGNVPINQNTCGTIVTKSYPECDRLGVFIKRCPPKRKDYMLIEKRLKSFDVNKWPDDLTQTREDLVDAGFFYCGLSDHVRCFHCGNGLRNWESGDIPWNEHARWYPHCHYVNIRKGQEFIEKRTGMWTYDRIDTMILDVKESITPQISKSHSCTEYTGMICPVTATQVSLTSGGEYTDIGGVKIVNSAAKNDHYQSCDEDDNTVNE
nr:death-associated inhibitor of apoptosis 2-like [Penaeus vannamei]